MPRAGRQRLASRTLRVRDQRPLPTPFTHAHLDAPHSRGASFLPEIPTNHPLTLPIGGHTLSRSMLQSVEIQRDHRGRNQAYSRATQPGCPLGDPSVARRGPVNPIGGNLRRRAAGQLTRSTTPVSTGLYFSRRPFYLTSSASLQGLRPIR